jgi:hypothetical protein
LLAYPTYCWVWDPALITGIIHLVKPEWCLT